MGWHDIQKWKHPDEGVLKLNVDVSVYSEVSSFGIGWVLRDYTGTFIEGKSLALPCPSTVFEAGSTGVGSPLLING